MPETEFNSALRVAVEFLQRLATEGPCHFGAACRILQHVAEALFRHKDAPADLESKLSSSVLRALPTDNGSPLRKELLLGAIRAGQQASRKREEDELTDVRVLMCNAPP